MRLMTFMDSYPSIPGPLQPSGPIFSQLKTLKVMDIYHLQVAKFVFKSMNLITPLNFQDWFKLNHELHAHKTRANFNIAEYYYRKFIHTSGRNNKLWVKTTESKWSKDLELFTY